MYLFQDNFGHQNNNKKQGVSGTTEIKILIFHIMIVMSIMINNCCFNNENNSIYNKYNNNKNKQ